jgi:hypothetical protein
VGGFDPIGGAETFCGSVFLFESVGLFDSVGTFSTAIESIHALPLEDVLHESLTFLRGIFHQRIRTHSCAASLLAFLRWCYI